MVDLNKPVVTGLEKENIIALLGYNSHSVKFILLSGTVQCFLVFLQLYSIHCDFSRTFSSSQNETLYCVSNLLPSSPLPSLTTTDWLIFMDLPLLDVSDGIVQYVWPLMTVSFT